MKSQKLTPIVVLGVDAGSRYRSRRISKKMNVEELIDAPVSCTSEIKKYS